jgi:hypothetical protein
MRTFENISKELGLKKFVFSETGTLYFVPAGEGTPRVIVRYFNGTIPAADVMAFARLILALGKWVELRPELARFVRIEQPIEVGYDFIARPHHTYYNSIYSYSQQEDPPEPPEELEEMQAIFRRMIGKTSDPAERIIEEILSRSLLEPTSKTYFSDEEGKFIVVDPKITREDLERWLAI